VNFSEKWQPAIKVLGTDSEARERGRITFAKWLRDREIDINELKDADFRIDSTTTPNGSGLMFSVKKSMLEKTV
jgi:phenolic acid decarboxylase